MDGLESCVRTQRVDGAGTDLTIPCYCPSLLSFQSPRSAAGAGADRQRAGNELRDLLRQGRAIQANAVRAADRDRLRQKARTSQASDLRTLLNPTPERAARPDQSSQGRPRSPPPPKDLSLTSLAPKRDDSKAELELRTARNRPTEADSKGKSASAALKRSAVAAAWNAAVDRAPRQRTGELRTAGRSSGVSGVSSSSGAMADAMVEDGADSDGLMTAARAAKEKATRELTEAQRIEELARIRAQELVAAQQRSTAAEGAAAKPSRKTAGPDLQIVAGGPQGRIVRAFDAWDDGRSQRAVATARGPPILRNSAAITAEEDADSAEERAVHRSSGQLLSGRKATAVAAKPTPARVAGTHGVALVEDEEDPSVVVPQSNPRLVVPARRLGGTTDDLVIIVGNRSAPATAAVPGVASARAAGQISAVGRQSAAALIQRHLGTLSAGSANVTAATASVNGQGPLLQRSQQAAVPSWQGTQAGQGELFTRRRS